MSTPTPSVSDDTSTDWSEMMETDDDASDEEPTDYVRIREPLPLGGLPVEVWMMVLEITDDPHALLASKRTCTALCDIVDGIVEKRMFMDLDLLAADPTRGYFMEDMTLRMDEILAWTVTYDMKIARPSTLQLSDGEPWLRSQTRSALSLVKSVTELQLSDTHFLSFSDFARMVCALPNLSTLHLFFVTLDGMGCDLGGVYFARTLRLKELTISACEFDEKHPFWNLLTAPSLSDSLESIDIRPGSSPGQSIPPPSLLSATLRRLGQLRLIWHVPYVCEGCPDVIASDVLSRSLTSRLTAIEIDHVCAQSLPPVDEWGRLLSIVDNAVATTDFSSLRTITVSLKRDQPFDLQSARAAVESQSCSPRWTEMFLMSSMSITINLDCMMSFSSGQVLKKTEGTTEPFAEGILLKIEIGPGHVPSNRIEVTYTRRGCA